MKQNLHSSVWKCWIITLIVLSHCLPSFSQSYGESTSYWEAGITVGPSNFLGDLGGTAGIGRRGLKDNNFPMTKLNFGAWLTYNPTDWLAFRLNLSVGSLEGDDAIIKGKGGMEEARKRRNSDFKSPLQEAFIAAEIYPTVFFEYEPSDVYKKLRPYGLIGVGVFRFNPKGTDPLTGQWVELRPLHTEGQGFPEFPDRKEYKLIQMNVPMGVGVKYYINDNMHVGLEVTFTDYIDDVSTSYIDPALFYAHLPLQQAQLAERMANKSGLVSGTGAPYLPGQKRGTAENNDAYYTFQVKFGLRLGNNDRWSTSTRCPVRF
jgi:hypothetical protein